VLLGLFFLCWILVVVDVLFMICCGEIFGFVGEFGSGKLMFVCCVFGLICLDVGCIVFDGVDVMSL